MDSIYPPAGNEMAVLPVDRIEDLVSNHFEKIFAFFDAFFQDRKVSIHYAESAFKAVATTGQGSLGDLYQWAAARIFRTKSSSLPLGLSQPMTMCLLLKELGNFRYGEIAEIMGLETQEVKHHIAGSRQTLTAQMV